MFKWFLRYNIKFFIMINVEFGKVLIINWINNFFKIVRKYNISICRNWKVKFKFKKGKIIFEIVYNLW